MVVPNKVVQDLYLTFVKADIIDAKHVISIFGPADSISKDLRSWIDKATNLKQDVLIKELESHLAENIFLEGSQLSDADIVIFASIHPTFALSEWTDEARLVYANVWRWFDHVQHQPIIIDSDFELIEFNKYLDESVFHKDKSHHVIPVSTKRSTNDLSKFVDIPDQQNFKSSQASNKGKELSPEELEAMKAKNAAKKAEKAAKKAAQATQVAAGSAKNEDELSVSKVDIRVGKILSAKKHPEADSLYVEEIDCGDETPRTVCSGLVKYIPNPEDLLGFCVVVCNLKPANMRGIKSEAMVLCATSPDGNIVELIHPPEGCHPGERVVFEGHSGEPDDQLNPKKKIFEKVSENFVTDDSCVAMWKNIPFMTSKGPCKSTSVTKGSIK